MATTDTGLSLYLAGLARHSYAYKDVATGKVYLALPERLPFQIRDDTDIYICKGGEYLANLAVSAYSNLFMFPIDLVSIIAQFQEEPIIDTSIPLSTRDIILFPSPEYIQEVAYGDSLTDYPKI